MKTKLLLLLLLANFSIYAQTNLVPNGDFENWTSSSQPDNWFRYFSGYISQSATAQNGLSSTKMVIASGTFNYINSEYFPVVANKTYKITLYHKLAKGTFSALDLSLYHKPGTFKSEITKKTDVVFSSTEWRKIEFEYTPTVSENIEIDIWATGTVNSEIVVDNISVIDINDVPVQYTLIPDINFEKKLIALGIDSGTADGQVLTSNLVNVTTLDVKNALIQDLSGIEDFVNLTDLNCSTNKLTSLNLSKNIKLKNLQCFSNSITSLDFSNNPDLLSASCTSNPLTNINVTKNTLLTKLTCDTQYLTSLDVSQNTQLTSLYCQGTFGAATTRGNGKLTSLKISSNTLLTNLECGNNQITNLDVSQNKALTILHCSFNRLSSLNTSDLNSLTSLQFSGNDVTGTVDVSKSLSLSTLNCASNKLTELNLSSNTALTVLDCSSNLLESLDLSKNSNLTRFRCVNNNLSALNLKNGNNTAFTIPNLQLYSNPNLKCIQVDDVNYSNTNWSTYVKDATAEFNTDCRPYTLIPDINFEKKLIALGIDSGIEDGKVFTENINTITDLDVSKSNITDLTGIQDFTALTYLHCGYNQIEKIDTSKNTKLVDFYCHYNAITSLDISNNAELVNFIANGNKLTSLDVSHNQKLVMLDCLENEITSLDISKNPNITELACENNKLTYLNLQNGNNTKLVLFFSNFSNNPDLTCIQVDDVSYSNEKWSAIKDATANYSLDCRSYTLIPDINFENKLIALGIDSGTADGKVLTSNVDSITELDLYFSNITDLTGIQDFKALTSLSCMSNKLSSIDISKNLDLNYLNLAYNNLTTIDISKNLALENIGVSYNNFTSIDVSNNINLNHLSCSSNQLNSIDVSNNKELSSLWCQGNQLTSLDLSKNKSLSLLLCSENKLLTNVNLKNGNNSSMQLEPYVINFTNNPLLTCIIVDNAIYSNQKWFDYKDASASYSTEDCSQITAIPDTAFEDKLIALEIDKDGRNGHVLNSSIVNVTSLDVSSSSIKDLTGIQGFTSLTSLNCSENLLSTLDLSENKALKLVNCSNNNALENLNLKNGNNTNFDLNSNFTTNPKLNCIQVDDAIYSTENWANLKDETANYNIDCNKYTIIADPNFEDKLIALEIDKDGKNGKVKTASIAKVTSLNLESSNISDLTGIEDFISLTHLMCNYNTISNINVENNKLLMGLELYDNKVTNLDVSKNTKLLNLTIGKNQISNIDLSHNIVLRSIIVNDNSLTNLDLTTNTALTIIDCSQNNLAKIDVTNAPDLIHFVCGQNNIASLDLSFNTKLEDLYCYNNELTILDLSKNVRLKRLNASRNQLTNVDLSHNPILELVFLEFNPLISLNVKNGNNKNFILPNQTGKKAATEIYTSFLGNKTLSCIKVDDADFSNANWSKIKESTTTYSETCTLGLEDSVFAKAAVYPNPTKGEVNIQNIALEKVTVYNSAGKLVKSFHLNVSYNNNQINLSGLPRGVYYLYLINQDAASAKKIVVE